MEGERELRAGDERGQGKGANVVVSCVDPARCPGGSRIHVVREACEASDPSD
jgi:hypothetical protein